MRPEEGRSSMGLGSWMRHEIKNKEAGVLKGTAHGWTENSHLCMKIFFLGCSEDFGRQFKNCIWKWSYITKKDRRFISCGVSPIPAFICKPWWWLVGQDEQDTCAPPKSSRLLPPLSFLPTLLDVPRHFQGLCLSLSLHIFARLEVTSGNPLRTCSLSVKST